MPYRASKVRSATTLTWLEAVSTLVCWRGLFCCASHAARSARATHCWRWQVFPVQHVAPCSVRVAGLDARAMVHAACSLVEPSQEWLEDPAGPLPDPAARPLLPLMAASKEHAAGE